MVDNLFKSFEYYSSVITDIDVGAVAGGQSLLHQKDAQEIDRGGYSRREAPGRILDYSVGFRSRRSPS
jgi:hypothetical protein